MQQTGTLLIGVPVFLCMMTYRLDGLFRLRFVQIQVTSGNEQRTTDNITECGEEEIIKGTAKGDEVRRYIVEREGENAHVRNRVLESSGEKYDDRKHRQHNLRDIIVRFERHEDGQTDEHVT